MLHINPYILTSKPEDQKVFQRRRGQRMAEAEDASVSRPVESAASGSDDIRRIKSETYIEEALRNAPTGDEPEAMTSNASAGAEASQPLRDGLAAVHAEHRELELLMSEYRKTPGFGNGGSSESRAKKLSLLRQLLELFEQQRHCESTVVLPVLLGLGMGDVGRALYERNLVDLSVSDQLAGWLWGHMPGESCDESTWKLFESTAEKFMLCVDEHRREQNDQVLSRLSSRLDSAARQALYCKWMSAKATAPRTPLNAASPASMAAAEAVVKPDVQG